jgi:hypothetical protein
MKSTTFRSVTRDKTAHARPDGHVIVTAAAIGGLSTLLVAGLAIVGTLDHMNAVIAGLVSRGGAEKFPRHLPDWCFWLGTVLLAFGISFAILGTPGQARRIFLWLTAVILVAAWAPVLSLASHAPAIAAPWIAAVWSGICALVYAANHHMPCDDIPPRSHDPR